MTCKVRCLKIKHRNQKLCASTSRTKTERATSSSRDMTPVKTMGLQSPDDDTLNTLLSSLFPQQ
uniref:Uncharacterized protein n=1 Tax=Vibrio parahaemolyticus TaxID=670 RepID=A0A1Y1BFF2_VIBPH|nr:hypothetical protein [Vibrio parahaemolyticus]